MSKLSLDVDFFKRIDTPQKAYWLGYICADGCIQKGDGKLAICCKDLEILEKFRKDINSEHKISERHIFDKRTNKWYDEYSLQIGNELFVKNIIEHGITHEKTDVCYFPSINEEFYSYFIAGLFDGDGSVSQIKKNNTIRCSLISTKEILIFIDNYLSKRYGVKPCKMQKISKNKINVYKQFWYKNSLLFLDFIYQGNKEIFLSRKYKIYEERKRV